jgi:hypothetical protein
MPSPATLWTVAIAAVAGLSLVFPLLALPAALGVFLGFLSLPKADARTLGRQRIAHAIAGVLAALSVLSFLVREGVPGIVGGGTRAAGQRAVSRLREILFAQDAARVHARWDPDGDGVGSALLLGELSGQDGVRGGARLDPPLLERYPRTEPVSGGRALEIGGYWFMVCVPKQGGLTSEATDPIDDEAAERRFVGYAWPSGRAPGLRRAYFIDEHDRILSAPSKPGLRSGGSGPRCDDALAPESRSDWVPWRNKTPRSKLPGG